MFHVDCPVSRLRICRCEYQAVLYPKPPRLPSAVYAKYAELIRQREEEDAAAPKLFPFRDKKKRRVESAAPRAPTAVNRTSHPSHAGSSHSDVQYTSSGRITKPPEEVAKNRAAGGGERISIAEAMVRRPRRAAALAAEKGRRALQEEEESLAQEEEEERKKLEVMNAANAQAQAQATYLAHQQQQQQQGASGGIPGAVPPAQHPSLPRTSLGPQPGASSMAPSYGMAHTPSMSSSMSAPATPAFTPYPMPPMPAPPRPSLPVGAAPAAHAPAPHTPTHHVPPASSPVDLDSPSSALKGGPAAKRANVSNIQHAPEGKGLVKYKYQCELCGVWLFPSGWGQHIKFCAVKMKKKNPGWTPPAHIAELNAKHGQVPKGVSKVELVTAQDFAPGGDLSEQHEGGQEHETEYGQHAGQGQQQQHVTMLLQQPMMQQQSWGSYDTGHM